MSLKIRNVRHLPEKSGKVRYGLLMETFAFVNGKAEPNVRAVPRTDLTTRERPRLFLICAAYDAHGSLKGRH